MQLIQKRKYVFTWLIFFMLAFAVQTVSAVEKAGDKATEIQKPVHAIVVTYFHTTMRCPTCHKIEELSTLAVKSHFEKELSTGKVVWRVINVDEPENAHYNKDYQLYTKSLIVSEVKDGKEVRWKNLEKIWEFVRDEEEFDKYVHTEIADWLKG
ncbi:MAG: nitrophenyl compound nitroreductase subunit ArsF family protein [Desulfosalsimonadaceae bacterium]